MTSCNKDSPRQPRLRWCFADPARSDGDSGFEFDITETEDVPGMFAGMYKGQYDVSEMSLGELIYLHFARQSRLRRDSGFSLAHVSPWFYFLPKRFRDQASRRT